MSPPLLRAFLSSGPPSQTGVKEEVSVTLGDGEGRVSASTGAVEAAGTGGAGRRSEVGDSTWGVATKDGQAVDAGIDAATATRAAVGPWSSWLPAGLGSRGGTPLVWVSHQHYALWPCSDTSPDQPAGPSHRAPPPPPKGPGRGRTANGGPAALALPHLAPRSPDVPRILLPALKMQPLHLTPLPRPGGDSGPIQLQSRLSGGCPSTRAQWGSTRPSHS